MNTGTKSDTGLNIDGLQFKFLFQVFDDPSSLHGTLKFLFYLFVWLFKVGLELVLC